MDYYINLTDSSECQLEIIFDINENSIHNSSAEDKQYVVKVNLVLLTCTRTSFPQHQKGRKRNHVPQKKIRKGLMD